MHNKEFRYINEKEYDDMVTDSITIIIIMLIND